MSATTHVNGSTSWFSKLRFSWQAKHKLVMQAEASECGIACLCMVSNYYGNNILLRDLRGAMPASQQGLSLHQLIDYALTLGLSSRPLKLDLQELHKLQRPAILHWDFSHFVVLTKVSKRYVFINDPAIGERKLSWQQVSKSFTGVALELQPNNEFETDTKPNTLSLWDLSKPIKGVKQQLSLLLGLSLLIQVFALASPFYMQTVVDKVLITSSKSFLMVLALGFSLLLIIESFTKWLREIVLLRFSNTFNLHISSSVLAHLLSLPLVYFQRRHIGDIVSRFGSLQPVRETLTQGLVTAIIDGTLSLATLVVMFIYAPVLALIVLTVAILYGLGRWALFYPIKQLNQQILQSDALQQSFFMQSIRALRTIKLSNTSASTHAKWMNLFISNINQRVRLSQWNIGFSVANNVLFGIENIIVVYVAATLVIANEFTIGMLFAFMSYKTRFVSSLISLVEMWIEYKIMSVHLSRIEDIVHQAPEVDISKNAVVSMRCQAKLIKNARLHNNGANIKISQLAFRYHHNQAWLFENVSINIDSGDYVAIVGASGCGKTSLINCLLGLTTPSKGKIHFNSALFSPQNRQHYNIAAVMQDDQLLTGSIIDNISQFADNIDNKRIVHAATLACIHEDIMRMTMQYQTLIGDMGDSLSGGQKQRIILARALYQQPDLLVLDEATSHLDISTEAQVCEHLKALSTTIVMVAHRPHTIATANKVYSLSNTGLKQINENNLPPISKPTIA